MSSKGGRDDNVVDFARFRLQRRTSKPKPQAEVYGRINAQNTVEYGLVDVSANDSLRLMSALFLIGLRLLEIRSA